MKFKLKSVMVLVLADVVIITTDFYLIYSLKKLQKKCMMSGEDVDVCVIPG